MLLPRWRAEKSFFLDEHNPIRVLIADDHRIVRSAIQTSLELEPSICIVAEATDGRSALQEIAVVLPDVAVVDLVMPDSDGLEVATKCRELWPSVRVLLVAEFADVTRAHAALVAGAAACIPKMATGAELREAVHTVAAKRPYLHASVARALLITARDTAAGKNLSQREAKALRLVALGHSSAEIASELGITMTAVETYKSRAVHKIGRASQRRQVNRRGERLAVRRRLYHTGDGGGHRD